MKPQETSMSQLLPGGAIVPAFGRRPVREVKEPEEIQEPARVAEPTPAVVPVQQPAPVPAPAVVQVAPENRRWRVQEFEDFRKSIGIPPWVDEDELLAVKKRQANPVLEQINVQIPKEFDRMLQHWGEVNKAHGGISFPDYALISLGLSLVLSKTDPRKGYKSFTGPRQDVES